jgi:hypothetical protein
MILGERIQSVPRYCPAREGVPKADVLRARHGYALWLGSSGRLMWTQDLTIVRDWQ